MRKDRFDLEQEILQCWNITSDIEDLRVALEGGMTPDQIDNYLLGLNAIYEIKFNKLFDTFGSLVEIGKLTKGQE